MSVMMRAGAAQQVLLLVMRLIGRCTASMIAPLDLMTLFLFAAATIIAMLGKDHSLTASYKAMCTIGLDILAGVLAKGPRTSGRCRGICL